MLVGWLVGKPAENVSSRGAGGGGGGQVEKPACSRKAKKAKQKKGDAKPTNDLDKFYKAPKEGGGQQAL